MTWSSSKMSLKFCPVHICIDMLYGSGHIQTTFSYYYSIKMRVVRKYYKMIIVNIVPFLSTILLIQIQNAD